LNESEGPIKYIHMTEEFLIMIDKAG